jgi:hypothetical protein
MCVIAKNKKRVIIKIYNVVGFFISKLFLMRYGFSYTLLFFGFENKNK